MLVATSEDLSHEHQMVIRKHMYALGSDEIRERDAAARVIHGAAAIALAMFPETDAPHRVPAALTTHPIVPKIQRLERVWPSLASTIGRVTDESLRIYDERWAPRLVPARARRVRTKRGAR